MNSNSPEHPASIQTKLTSIQTKLTRTVSDLIKYNKDERLITPRKSRSIIERIMNKKKDEEEDEDLETEYDNLEILSINAQKEINSIRKQIAAVQQNIKNPLFKYELNKILNQNQGQAVHRYGLSTKDTLAIMQVQRLYDITLLESLIQQEFSLKETTNEDTIKEGLRNLYNRCPKLFDPVILQPKSQKNWIEDWKTSKRIIVKPPFREFNLSRYTKQFREEIYLQTGIRPENIYEPIRGEPLSIGTFFVDNNTKNIKVIIEQGFGILEFLDFDSNEDLKDKLKRIFIPVNVDKVIIEQETKKQKKLVNYYFIKDFVYRTLKEVYTLDQEQMNKLIKLMNNKKNKNKFDTAKTVIYEYIDKQTVQVKSIFKRLIGKTNFVTEKSNTRIRTVESNKVELVPDYKQSSQIIEYWVPQIHFETGAPVNEQVEEIKNIKMDGRSVYLKLQRIDDPIHGNDQYFYRKFIDFNDFLMAWYDRYHEMHEFTFEPFYKQRMDDILAYFKKQKSNDKLRKYIQIINENKSL